MNAAIKLIEQFEFHQTLESTSGVSIVFFSSQECMSCRFWQQLLERYNGEYPEINIFKIDAGKDQALTEEFNVFHLPALFLYQDGAYQSDLQCEATMSALKETIDTALAQPAQECP